MVMTAWFSNEIAAQPMEKGTSFCLSRLLDLDELWQDTACVTEGKNAKGEIDR